jgi:ABC-type nitrate/sulfonate/bicarbonate transport system substrate-binding protein
MLKTVAAATLAASIVAAAPYATGQQMEETSMTLPALTLGFSPTYIADEMGFWTKRGLKVNMHSITGIGSMNAVLSGSVDFTNSSGPTVIRANVRGQKVQGIGSTYDGLPFELVVRKEILDAAGVTESSPLEKRAQAIKGKKISLTSPNTIPHGYLRYFARKGGLNPDRDIQIASMAAEAGLAGLKTAAIDGYIQGPPWTVVATHQNLAVRLDSSLRGSMPELLPFAYNIVAAKPETCEKRPSVCQKLMDGYLDGMLYMNDHPDESLAILQKRMPGGDREVFKEAFDLTRKSTPRTTKINDKGLLNAQELSIDAVMIKPEEKLARFDGIFTNKFTK